MSRRRRRAGGKFQGSTKHSSRFQGATKRSKTMLRWLTPRGKSKGALQSSAGKGASQGGSSSMATMHSEGARIQATAGAFCDYRLQKGGLINKATLAGVDATGGALTGNAVVDIRTCSHASYPTGFASICASAKPTLTGAQKVEDATLTGWNKTLTAQDWIRIYVVSADTFTVLTAQLTVS